MNIFSRLFGKMCRHDWEKLPPMHPGLFKTGMLPPGVSMDDAIDCPNGNRRPVRNLICLKCGAVDDRASAAMDSIQASWDFYSAMDTRREKARLMWEDKKLSA